MLVRAVRISSNTDPVHRPNETKLVQVPMIDMPKDPVTEARAAVLGTARFHVIFDGWSEAMYRAAVAEAGIDGDTARQAFPRGVIDLAYEFHLSGDRVLAQRLADADLSKLRYSEKVGHAVMTRLEIAAEDREAVRRAAAFFALPMHVGTGSRALWHTADTVWTALGDTSQDVNWYSKRAILSGVYSSSLLYWLGDESDAFADTRAFVDRRIGDVMSFEKTKARVRDSALGKAFMQGPGRLLDLIKAPGQGAPDDLPGRWAR